jgi:hypothetical protein
MIDASERNQRRELALRVAEVVKRLDVQAGPLTSIFRVYPLHNASAAQIAPRADQS